MIPRRVLVWWALIRTLLSAGRLLKRLLDSGLHRLPGRQITRSIAINSTLWDISSSHTVQTVWRRTSPHSYNCARRISSSCQQVSKLRHYATTQIWARSHSRHLRYPHSPDSCFLGSLELRQPFVCYFHPFFTLETSSLNDSNKHGPQSSSKLKAFQVCGVFACVCLLFVPSSRQNGCDGGSFLLSWCRLFLVLNDLCFLSNTQARDENESRNTRLRGGKSFFQKPGAKPRAALGSIANTLVERNVAGKVSSVSTWFTCGSPAPLQIRDLSCKIHCSPSLPAVCRRLYITPHHPYTSLYAIPT